MKIPRIVIAGTSSGVGKTAITCGIIYALMNKGYTVQPFKVGPDYIDPGYLSSISSNQACNLDVWLMGKDKLVSSFVLNSNSDVSVIEGVMGFYDGSCGSSNYASTHHVATLVRSPVILVLDASKTARSIAATVLGFEKFHKNSRISGLILNKIGSKKHELLCRQALERTKIPIVGVIPKDHTLNLESRHLGLVSTFETTTLYKKIKKVSQIISENIDIDSIIKILNRSRIPLSCKKLKSKKSKSVIAVALDTSFNFYYKDNLDSLERQGALLKFFSPVNDKSIPSCDGLYIGGGFPEILGTKLAKNQKMKSLIKKFSEQNLPIYAECGGLMYLTKAITINNQRYKMVGLYDAETVMTKKMQLNYTKGKMNPCLISDKLHSFQGHEFHYSKLDYISEDSKFAYDLDIGNGIKCQKDGLVQDNTLASYGHLYFDSSNYSEIFVRNCIKLSKI